MSTVEQVIKTVQKKKSKRPPKLDSEGNVIPKKPRSPAQIEAFKKCVEAKQKILAAKREKSNEEVVVS